MTKNAIVDEFKISIIQSLSEMPTCLIHLICGYDSRFYTPEQLFSVRISHNYQGAHITTNRSLYYICASSYYMDGVIDLSDTLTICCGLQRWVFDFRSKSRSASVVGYKFVSNDRSIEVETVNLIGSKTEAICNIKFNIQPQTYLWYMALALKRRQLDDSRAQYETLQSQL